MVLSLLMVFVFQYCVVVAARITLRVPSSPDSRLMLRGSPKPFGSVREKNLRVSPSAV